jgi:hypothetical protein
MVWAFLIDRKQCEKAIAKPGLLDLIFGTHEIGFEFDNNPPHQVRNGKFAQFSLFLTAELQKIDFKLQAPFDFA